MREDTDAGEAASGWSQPLRLHLSVVIVLLLLGVALPLIALTYVQGTRSAVNSASVQMQLLSQQVIERYRAIFAQGLTTITLASAGETFLDEPPETLPAKVDFLFKALAESPNLDGVYVGYPTGTFLHAVHIDNESAWKKTLSAPDGAVFAARTVKGSDANRQSSWGFYDIDQLLIGERSLGDPSYDPTSRPWYKAASKSGAAVAVGPYVMATTKMLGLTIATPMDSDQGIVIGADVILETISHLLSRQSVSANAVGYVFDDRRRLIVHSDPEIMKQVLASLDPTTGRDVKIGDPAFYAVRAILDKPAGTSQEPVTFDVAGEPYLAVIATTGNSNVVKQNTVVIAAPMSDFTGESVDLLRKSLLIAGTLLGIGIGLALLIARIVSRSLSSLTADAEQIGNLEFDEESRVHSSVIEIKKLAGALAAARQTIGTFALYVPRELVRKIVTAGQATAGMAVRQEVTVLFTDIQDFTTISERHPPEAVVGMLSDYFQLMNEIVVRYNGVIIQYLGDAIYAMWNAPTPDPTHVEDACHCALDIKTAIDDFNTSRRLEGKPELVTRYGIHTGVAVVGSVGAKSRQQYTAMGDTVNVASRLEGINKEFGTTILVSGAVYERANATFTFRSLGQARAKGRSEQIEVFELTGRT